MRALDRKLVRDLARLRGQAAAVGLVVACGIALFVTLRTTYGSLLETRDRYYERYRFADVFASLRHAPDAVAGRIAAIDGVAAVRTRVVADVVLEVPGLAEPATGRLVSVPPAGGSSLNDVHLRRGRHPDPGSETEALASEAFVEANRLEPGDAVSAVIHGRWRRLRIVGVAISPEYVYEIGGAAQVFPDNRRFGVLWMDGDALASAFDLEGGFDDVAVSLAPGASEAAVIAGIDRVLDRYGGLGAYGRGDQISNRFLSDEIAEIAVTSVLIPGIFLAVTAFLLHTMMVRIVATEREEIGALKAFGYGDGSVAAHYLGLAAAPVAGGAAVGVAFGLWLSGRLAGLYERYFHFPELVSRPRADVVAMAVGIAAGAALVGAWRAIRQARALPPAEAMRPPAPARFRPGPLERLGVSGRLSPAGRTIVRNLERWPAKAVLSTLGIAVSIAIVLVGGAMFDAIDRMKEVQFEAVARDDATVTFDEPLSGAAVHALARTPGVLRVEPYRAVGARIRSGSRSRRVTVLGLDPGSELRRIVDEEGRVHPVPAAGALLTAKLGEILGVDAGSTVRLEVLEGERPVREVRVAGLVDETIGTSVYMDRATLGRILGEGGAVSGAWLSLDAAASEAVYAELRRTPAVAGVGVREAALRGFETTVAESFRLSIATILGFACVIAFGVVYNGARIALSERARELASLRVLGFTRAEVARMLLGEQALLTGLAVPFGWAIGLALCALIATRFDTELFRMPIVVEPRTYAIAFLVVAAAAAVSALAVKGRIDRLDLVAVLKSRE